MKNRSAQIQSKELTKHMADISRMLWNALTAWLGENGHNPDSLPPPFVTMAVLHLCLGMAATSTNPPGDKLASAEIVKKMLDLVDAEDQRELFAYLSSLAGGYCTYQRKEGKE